ncbi:MAG TPA: molybdenum cofactor biosynthesis protein MoaE [Gemmatimonadales bacterium]|nr:molybdenum cofactor biosynthesis protein MoaE [Gemmatimonadales bacterium]
MAEGRYLTRRPIEPEALLAAVNHPGLGGTVLFLGTVRCGPDDGPVTAIEYTAYEEMVAAEFDRILGEARQRWPGGRVAACHRLGTVPAGEASIAIAAAMPHRADAFAACRYVIEEVKRRLPVWKQEVMDDGTRRWREAQAGAEPAEEAEEAGGAGGPR